jgi:uncharacterized phage-like protein YoqJ
MMGYHGTLTNFFSGPTVEASEIEKREGHGANGKPYTRSFVWLTFKGQEPVEPEPTPQDELFEMPDYQDIDYDKMMEAAGMENFSFEDAFGVASPTSVSDLEEYAHEYDVEEEESETQLFNEALNAEPAPPVVAVNSSNFKSTTLGLANREADKREVEAKLGLPENGQDFAGHIQTPNGTLIAVEYVRVVYGDHGPYIEFNANSVNLNAWTITRKSAQAWYDEARKDGVMLYIQKRDVSTLPNPPAGKRSTRNNRPEGYADYRPGMLYVDPFAIRVAPESTKYKAANVVELVEVDGKWQPKNMADVQWVQVDAPAVVPAPAPSPAPVAQGKPYRVAFTGHRPEKIGGYDENHPMRIAVKNAIADALKRAVAKYGATREIIVVTGGALGVDTDAAREAYKLGLKYVVARPCSDHGQYFKGQDSQARYKKMLALAHEVVLVNDKPYDLAGKGECLHARNRWMVDNCDAVVAIWDGSPSGTSNCVNYAKQVNRPMIIINPNDLVKK